MVKDGRAGGQIVRALALEASIRAAERMDDSLIDVPIEGSSVGPEVLTVSVVMSTLTPLASTEPEDHEHTKKSNTDDGQ